MEKVTPASSRLLPADTFPLVAVVFRDITQTADWTPHTEVECISVTVIGVLIHQDTATVKLATTYDEEGNWSAVCAIPTGCVVKVIPLKELSLEELQGDHESS